MNETKHRVIFKGGIADGEIVDDVKERLAAALKLDITKITPLFTGKTTTIKKNATQKQCEAIKKRFTSAGAICFIEPEIVEDNNIEENSPPETPPGPPSLGPPPLPKRKVTGPEQSNGQSNEQLNVNSNARKADERFCEFCGEVIKINVLACPGCGRKLKRSGSMPGCAIAAIIVGVFFVGIAIIGILAAIAIPNFIAYRNKAYQASVQTELQNLATAQKEYFMEHERYTDNLEDLSYVSNSTDVEVIIVEADENCFEAKGTVSELAKDIWIDCNDNVQETEKETSQIK